MTGILITTTKNRWKWWQRSFLTLAFLMAIVGGSVVISWYERYAFNLKAWYQIAMLAHAFNYYYHDYGTLPPDLGVLKAAGLVTPGAFRLPANGWESAKEQSGAEMIYCPVVNWDGNVPFVIVVQPRVRNAEFRRYLVAGKMAITDVPADALKEVLARDDELRIRMGQPFLWREMGGGHFSGRD